MNRRTRRRTRPPSTRLFGPYELRSVLGEGGMAKLYDARVAGVEPAERVVIKVIRRELRGQAEFRSMFEHEARLGRLLDHPAIPRVLDSGEIGGRLYFALERVDGLPLSRILSALGGVPIALALGIVADIADALAYAHEAVDEAGRPLGIIHRDISPDNVLISREGRIKLIDFGIARSRVRGDVTGSGVLKGKLNYMAPEQLRGQVDHRADIFALGVVLHELVSGRRLFKRKAVDETVAAIQHEPIPPLDAPRLLRAHLQPIADRALARDRRERYPTARGLLEDLQRARSMLGLSHTRRGLAGLVRNARRRRPTSAPRLRSVDPYAPTELGGPDDTPTRLLAARGEG